MNEFVFYAAAFSGFSIFAWMLHGLLLRISENLGIRNHDVSIIRWSNRSKPAMGGITFYILFLVAAAGYMLFFHQESTFNYQVSGVVTAVTLAFLAGLIDDAYNTKPWFKLGAQILCGFILTSTGTGIVFFESVIANHLLTIFWVVGVMNSINMLDNMDAITAITALFILLAAFYLYFFNGGWSPFFVTTLLGMTAAVFTFLFYNWYPSKMFMGDSGSQVLGVYLAIAGTMCFWNHNTGEAFNFKPIILTLLAFVIPISDSAIVTFNRLMRGQSPLLGGKDHTSHHLSYLGLSDRQVAIVFSGISLLSFILITIVINFISWNTFYAAGFALYFILVFSLLFYCTKIKKAKKFFHEQNQPLSKKDPTS